MHLRPDTLHEIFKRFFRKPIKFIGSQFALNIYEHTYLLIQSNQSRKAIFLSMYSSVPNITVGNPYYFLMFFPPTWSYLELLVYF